jgi:pyrroloquinoline quinone biosynthesis protein B
VFIKVLGSAAGGGFPQWNCNAPTSRAAWAGEAGATARTQSSVAVSSDGASWVLLNASPDICHQIAMTPQLQPQADGPLRNSPIRAVVLTNADVDHVAGLLSLRERQPFTIFAADRVLGVLAANSIFNVLDAEIVPRKSLSLDGPMALKHGAHDLGLAVHAFVVPGKIALYLEDAAAGRLLGTQAGDTIGLAVSEPTTGATFFYIPACAMVDADLARRIRGAAVVFFDGTLYADDELLAQGLSNKTGQRMGHISMSGAAGSMAALADLGIGRRIYIHINTSNPALIEGSCQRRDVEAAGWEIAYDGMEVRL